MRIAFDKYHGTGNDFVMLDVRNQSIPEDPGTIAYLCHRRFGIGSDGLIMLGKSKEYDFSMRYFNSNGKEASMCGNGGRCIIAFANKLGIINDKAVFEAVDGIHRAHILANDGNTSIVKLQMGDVAGSEWNDDEIFLDTGSPHLVKLTSNLKELDVNTVGRHLRVQERFGPEGTNVNFIEKGGNGLHIRTYERGVESETYSCGTGATAAALAWSLKDDAESPVNLECLGGTLRVHFERTGTDFKDIYLEGPAERVFSGEIEI